MTGSNFTPANHQFAQVFVNNQAEKITIAPSQSSVPSPYLYSQNSNGHSGITWENITIIDSPYLPIDPTVVVDSNNTIHILWANYATGRSLHHIIMDTNGTIMDQSVLENYGSGTPIQLDAVADSYGRVHLAFSWGINDDGRKVYYRVWENGLWSSAERVDLGVDNYGLSVCAHHPKIAVSKEGIPHIIWSGEILEYYDLTTRPTYYQRRLGSESWSSVIFTGYAKPGSYTILITNNDIVHVAFTLKSSFFLRVLYRKKDINASTWGSEVELYDNYVQNYNYIMPSPELLAINNTIHCFAHTMDENYPEIIYLKKESQTWTTPIILTNKTTSLGNLKLSATASAIGDIVLTWPNNIYEGGPFEGGIHHQTYNFLLDNWSSERLVTENYTTAYHPFITTDANDTIHMIWRDNHPVSGQALYYVKGEFDLDSDGLTNNEEINVYNTDPNDPDSDDDLLNDGDEVALGLDPLNPDEDSDLILDGWEIAYGLDPYNTTDAGVDFEPDGLTNIEEFTYNTHPNNPDTDNDSLTDGDEVNTHGTDPTNDDSDNDQLSDGDEILTHGTDPLNNDTEGDGMGDGYEVFYGLNPLFNDSADDPDIDLLTNLEEFGYGTSPITNDTDFDALDDYVEIFTYQTNPLSSDTDSDLLTDHYEVMIDPLDNLYQTNNTYQTNPLAPDTDNDALDDIFELDVTLTNPVVNDTDGDLILDGYEVTYGLDPFLDDSLFDYDEDGLTNFQEFIYSGDPFDSDTDNDGLSDSLEVFYGTSLVLGDTDFDQVTDYNEIIYYNTNATNPDTDYDGLDDFYECIIYKSNPNEPDTDGDTLLDGEEVWIYGSSPLKVDTDGDGLGDLEESLFNSNPSDMDTDNDGMFDLFEWTYGFDPNFDDSKEDPDVDGLTNVEEYWFFSDPFNNDTDNDLLLDGLEAYVYFTSPRKNDTDDDLLLDYEEVFVFLTSPTDPDTDDDGLSDGEELLVFNTNPFEADSDNDGTNDFEEIEQGTDPLNPKDHPRRRIRIYLLSASSAIFFGLSLYYFTPYLFQRFRRSIEMDWILDGVEKREIKHKEMFEKNLKNSD